MKDDKANSWYFRTVTAVATAAIAIAHGAASQESARIPIDRVQAVYGLAVDPVHDEALLLGTEFGLLRAAPDGMAEPVETPRATVIGLNADPNAPDRLLASGFSETGVPAGLLISDAGVSGWSVVPGTAGEDGLALTSLSVSRLDSANLAGLDEKIRLSTDGGLSWKTLETTPEKTFSVALSGADSSRIFAATMAGVMVRDDHGMSWKKSDTGEAPATAIASLSGGRVAAFVYGTGVIMADEATLDWQITATGFEDRYLRVLAEAPSAPGTLYAVADTGAILLSRDGGKSWFSFEGNDLAVPERIEAGKTLYADNCQACHGVGGIGENPADPSAQDEFGFKAPALNDATHAWHHSDAGLRATIHEGSSRNERMIAWQEVLSDDEIDSILAYVKSTWSIRSQACQGARHMACMGH
jgi:mono/diheme cytochrome c family protein